MTIEQFRACCDLKFEYNLVELPFFPMAAGIEEIERSRATYTHVASEELIKSICKNGTSYRSAVPRMNRGKQFVLPVGNARPKTQTKRRGGPRKNNNQATKRQKQSNDQWQRGKYANAPTVEQQLKESADRLKRQREELRCVTKKKSNSLTLLNFMTLQSDSKKT
jgi:hypothetical protein